MQINASQPIVSEHAILRYLERVKGMDIESLKNEILDHKTVEHIKFAKNCNIKKATHTLVVKNNTIITVEN